jgi:hypothetical protein
MQSHEAGAPVTLFVPPPGRSADHPGAGLAPFIWTQAALTPLAPAHLRTKAQANGDTLIQWIRCARAGGDAWGPAEPPHETEGEAYQVTILRDGAPVREAVTQVPAYLYPAAQRAADFAAGGAALVRVRQRGAGGRLGWARESAL